MIILNKRDSLFWKLSEYAIYLVIVLFPFINFNLFLYPATSTRSLMIVAFACIVGIVFSITAFKKNRAISIPKSPIFLAVLVYILFMFVSALLGENLSISFWSVATRNTGIWYLLSIAFFTYIFWGVVSDRIKQNRIILLTIVSAVLYSVLSFLSPEGIGWFFDGYETDGFTLGNSTFAAMYIYGAFLLSIWYFFQAQVKKWWMYVLPFLLVINPYILARGIWTGDFSQGIVGEARATSYVMLFSVISLVIFWGISKIKVQKTKTITIYSIFSFSILALIFGAFSLLSENGYLRNVYLSQATGSRPLVWEMSRKVILENPVFGWGSDNFERVLERNYDSRLLEEKYGNEAWFDRAHNVFVDQLVDNGFVGLIFYILVYLTIILSLIYVILNSAEKNDRVFAGLLIIYFAFHFVELQTAFDTTISYLMVAMMVAFAAVLFDRVRMQITKENNEWDIDSGIKYPISIVVFLFFTFSLFRGLIPFVNAQTASGNIRIVGSSEKRVPLYNTMVSSPVDGYVFLWKASLDLQKAIAQNPKIIETEEKVTQLRKELVALENAFKEYISDNPLHYRAHLSLADILIYQRVFGVDKLNEAQKVLDSATSLVPQAPQAYWMKAVAYVYMRKFPEAREFAKKGYEINPEAKQSQEVLKYIEKSIKEFPEIDLYFFRQI